MHITLAPGEEPTLIDFENAQDMLRKQEEAAAKLEKLNGETVEKIAPGVPFLQP